MDEKTFMELLNYIDSNYTNHVALHARSEQYAQAVEWARQSQRWDLILSLGHDLYSHYVHSKHEFLNIGESEPPSENARDFWEQGRWLAMQGVLAAREVNNPMEELWFLGMLSRLSMYLGDFQVALGDARQQLRLAEDMEMSREERVTMKADIVHRIHVLGNEANRNKDFLAARACYQTVLDAYQEHNDKYLMAEELLWIMANEQDRIERDTESGKHISDDLVAIIESLRELTSELRHGARLEAARSKENAEPLGDPIYTRLQDTLTRLNSLT
jgi:hypothetical protein